VRIAAMLRVQWPTEKGRDGKLRSVWPSASLIKQSHTWMKQLADIQVAKMLLAAGDRVATSGGNR
jgi:hypothetical protein